MWEEAKEVKTACLAWDLKSAVSSVRKQHPPRPSPAPCVRMVRSGKPGRAAVDVARIHAEEGRDASRLR